MKYLYIFFTLLFLSSCSSIGYHNFRGSGTRLVKVDKKPVSQPQVTAQNPVRAETPQPPSEAPAEKQVIAAASSEKEEQAEASVQTTMQPEYAPVQKEKSFLDKISPSDTIVETDLAVQSAIKAEKMGKSSATLGIIGIILTVVPFTTIAGLVLSIIAFNKGRAALRSRYITPEGLRKARVGVILSSISIGLYALVILAVAITIIVLLV